MNAVRTSTVFITFALAACAVTPLAAQDPASPPTWELRPYEVHVAVAVQPASEMPIDFERDLAPWLKAKAAASVGGMWNLHVSAASPDLRPKLLAQMDSLTAEDVPEPKGADKLILVGISRTAEGWQVRAREFDVVTGLWNSTISRDVRQSKLLRHETFSAVMSAFAPHARIEQAEEDSVTLRLRASALSPGPEMPLAPGTVFRPVLVSSDAQGSASAGKVELIDWTYLISTADSGMLIECRLLTALRGPVIPEYHPQRQRLAVAVAPATAEARLRLVRGSDAEPVEGCDVVAVESLPAGGTTKETPIGRTDRRGEVTLPSGPQAVRLIEVRFGEAVLARVPIVPGLAGEVTLPVQFDSKLISLESALSQLEDELVDLSARRAVLSARIAAAEKNGKAQDAAALRSQLREAGGAEALLARLDKLQQQVQSASPQTQRRMQERLAHLRKVIDQLKAPAAM